MKTKKDEVINFLEVNIRDINYCLSKKDNFGKPAWCPASRCAFKKKIEYYEYLLRVVKNEMVNRFELMDIEKGKEK